MDQLSRIGNSDVGQHRIGAVWEFESVDSRLILNHDISIKC